jgi:hypothetical protein
MVIMTKMTEQKLYCQRNVKKKELSAQNKN